MAKNTQQNIEEVKVAIGTLSETNKKITVKAISELTGITKAAIYKYEVARQYVRHHKEYSPRVLFVPSSPQEDDELDRILASIDSDNPFNEPEPAKVKEKPKAESYELRFQMPLSGSKYFLMSFPSDIDDEDKQDIADYLAIVLKRKLKI
ncbi:hypothetical protein JAO10_09235 [Burkholderia contaminans]|uniref:DUF6262 family protein n=1 Tax=Burkholderia cepacia complex TaxID=87882 RepID=UPI001593BDE0|nr:MULTISPECIES: DUF6262 family protein [Burkholderia cepacia complex]MBH9720515.1 hypothetical protein [Burkholderia contaminans]